MSHFFDDLEGQLRTAAQQLASSKREDHPARPWWRRPRNGAVIVIALLGFATPTLARVSGIWSPDVAPLPPAHTVTAQAGTEISCDVPRTEPRRTTSRSTPSSATTNDEPVDAQLSAILGVLRRPYTQADDSTDMHAALRAGVNPRNIRYVGSVEGQRFFAVPNNGVAAFPQRCLEGLSPEQRAGLPPRTNGPQVCLLGMRGGGGCGGVEAVRTEGIFGSSGTDDDSIVTGLVPDGITAVTVTYGTSTRTFPVHDNFYGYTIALSPQQQPDRIGWQLADDTTRVIRP